MKRRHVLAIFVLVIASYLAAWHLAPSRELSFLVVDKTVPDEDFREHRAIFWIAEAGRYQAPGGRFLNHETDYLGYHPQTGEKQTVTSGALEGITLLYLADSYGIYDYPEGLEAYEQALPFARQEIDLIYGGFDRDEAEAIASYAASENRILVGEHNIAGYPTYLDAEAAAILQELFGISYSGWLTRYYPDLDEAAFWLKEQYAVIYGQQWDKNGPGMIFVREDYGAQGWLADLIVLERGDLDGPWPLIETATDPLTEGAARAVPYLYWVEVLEVSDDARVLAYFEPPLTAEALGALEARGLAPRFPAMIYLAPPGEAVRIYFAGDFADQLPALLSPRLTGSAALQRFFSYLPGLPVEYRFYFQWYEPVLGNILEKGAAMEHEQKSEQ